MPVVPTINREQQSTALKGGQLADVGNLPLMPSNIPQQAFGIDIEKPIAILGRIMAEEKQKADGLALLATENEISNITNPIESEVTATKGQGVFGATAAAMDKFDKQTENFVKNAPPSQQAGIQKLLFAYRNRLLNNSERHTSIESNKYHDGNFKAAIDNAKDNSVSNRYNPDELKQSLDNLEGLIGNYAKFQGWSETQKEAYLNDIRYKTIESTVKAAIGDGDYKRAQEIYKDYQHNIMGDKSSIQSMLKTASVNGEAFKIAQAAIYANTPKIQTNEMSVLNIMNTIKKDNPNISPEIYLKAIDIAKEEASIWKQNGNIISDDNENKVYADILKKIPLSAIMRKDYFLSLDGKTQEKIVEAHKVKQEKETQKQALNSINKIFVNNGTLDEAMKSPAWNAIDPTIQIGIKNSWNNREEKDENRAIKMEKRKLETAQQDKFNEIVIDYPVLIDDKELVGFLAAEEINQKQYNSLIKIRERFSPTNQEAYKNAISAINKTKFNKDASKDQEIKLGLKNTLSRIMIENPDADTEKFFKDINKPISETWMQSLTDVFSYGRPGEEEARGKVIKEAVEKAKPKETKQAKYKEGDTATNKITGEKMIFRGGKWQKTK